MANRAALGVPRGVAPGDMLGVFAPSSPFQDERFERGLTALRALGYGVHVHPQVHRRHGFLAGTDAERLAAFHELLADDAIAGVIAARGGYGLHRIIAEVDADLVRRSRKPIVGFSDITALHGVIQARAGLVSIHGPVVTQLGTLPEADRARLVQVLAGAWDGLTYHADRPAISGGRATGTLVGGCLAVLVAMVGTPHLFVPDDAILLLEDVGEAPYRIDRMLTHLRLAGVLGGVRAVALGDFAECDPPRPGEQTVDEVLAERLGDLGVPVLAGLPIGHGPRNHAIPLGARATVDAEARTLTVARPLAEAG